MDRITVQALPALSDNYIYLLRDRETGACAVVDPAEAGPVLEELAARPGHLAAILLTHHHSDHVAGVGELLNKLGRVPVFGSALDRGRVPEITVELGDGDEVEFAGERARVLLVPGHTRGHIAYHFPASRHLFCGDVLFGAGCGRPFEGTPEQMHRSLMRLADLPDETQVWCGHEYTRDNVRFALTIDPDNAELAGRSTTPPTVPLDLGQEKRINPFLRTQAPAVKAAVGQEDPVQVFAAVRELKNQFK